MINRVINFSQFCCHLHQVSFGITRKMKAILVLRANNLGFVFNSVMPYVFTLQKLVEVPVEMVIHLHMKFLAILEQSSLEVNTQTQ